MGVAEAHCKMRIETDLWTTKQGLLPHTQTSIWEPKLPQRPEKDQPGDSPAAFPTTWLDSGYTPTHSDWGNA